jgi:hypothetical protein
MQRATNTATVSANTLHCALEMSKKTWLLAIQFPDREQPSVYSVKGGGRSSADGKADRGARPLGQGQRHATVHRALL